MKKLKLKLFGIVLQPNCTDYTTSFKWQVKCRYNNIVYASYHYTLFKALIRFIKEVYFKLKAIFKHKI